MLYCIALAVSLFQSLAIPITYWLEASNSLEYINEWYYFQDEFGKDELDFAYTRQINMLGMIHAPVLISILAGGAYFLNDFRFFIFSSCVAAMDTLIATLLIWSITLYELRTASEILLKRIIRVSCQNMYQHRIIWLKLSNMTTSIGESVGHTGLAVFVLVFTTFVLTTYGFLSLAIDHSFTKSFGVLLSTSTLCMIVQLILCDTAHRTTQAVGEKFCCKLIELSPSTLSQRDQSEMNLLLQSMVTNPPVIHFMGYVIINRKIFVKFISDTVTYLVVLIQFKMSSFTRIKETASKEEFN